MNYESLVDCFQFIENTKGAGSTQASLKHLSELFLSLLKLNDDGSSLMAALYLSTNSIYPASDGVELGVGSQLVLKSLEAVFGVKQTFLKTKLKEIGDLGDVAYNLKQKQKTIINSSTPLTIESVLRSFREISKTSGDGSQSIKVCKISKLLVDSKGYEVIYIVRALLGKMRIGLGEKSIIHALGLAFEKFRPSGLSEKDVKISITNAFSKIQSYERLIETLTKFGLIDLESRCGIQEGCGFPPMLAHPTNGIKEILDRQQNWIDNNKGSGDGSSFTCEFKYDGERAQIHKSESGIVQIFSRNMENSSQKYPDVVHNVINEKFAKDGIKSFIIDCEIVAYDSTQKIFRPFQVLSTRHKKHATINDITVPVIVMIFDLLSINGSSLIDLPLSERRKKMTESFNLIPNKFDFAKFMDSNDPEEIQEFLDEAINNQCEGLMIKNLDSAYEISKRSWNWLKLKKDYINGLGDTFDLVPIGAYFGKGKRTNVYGSFILACYCEENESYQTICKIGTGFSDDLLNNLKKTLKVVKDQPPNYNVHKSQTPDVWFKPTQVWEVLAADMTKSPVYMAGSESGDGISLRFPRLVRIRDDKSPQDCTNSDQIRELFLKQFKTTQTKKRKRISNDEND